MSIPGSAEPLLLAQQDTGGYQIQRSLRFNSSDSGFCSRTFSSTGNRTSWTWSGWVKRSNLVSSSRQVLFGGYGASNDTDWLEFGFGYSNEPNDTFYWTTSSSSSSSTAVFRDLSAWYHVLVSYNGSNIIAYVNNTTILTSSKTGNLGVNGAWLHTLGRSPNSGIRYFDGYLADVHFIDGQALDPSSFTEVSATTGQLLPRQYTGSFGTNGFWLKFSDNSAATATTLGKDYSGNSNNWSPTNLSVTAGAGNDSLTDTPTSYGTDTGAGGEVRGNYATLNPLDKGSSITLSNGNLDYAGGGSSHTVRSTIQPKSGKWYWEANGDANTIIGIASSLDNVTVYPGDAGTSGRGYFGGSGISIINGSVSATWATFTSTDVIGLALDVDAGTCAVYKNNSLQGTWTGLTNPVPAIGRISGIASINFGQRPFAYTAPSGFKALCDTNLPAPVVAKPSTAMDVKLYTGTGSNQSITGLGFSPDFVWIKSRSTAEDHNVFDAVRGPSSNLYALQTNATSAEGQYGTMGSLDANGFSLTGAGGATNANGTSYVAWAFDAGTTTTTNTAGSITSSCRTNQSSGFSVITYSGNGSTGSVGHGLNVAPQFIVYKIRNGSSSWQVYHASLGATKYLNLDTTDAVQTSNTRWNDTAPSSTVVSLGTNGANSFDYVMYAWAPVAGYSSAFSFSGNGSSSDGPMVWLGFKPKLLLIKRSDSTGNWLLVDSVRGAYNLNGTYLYANTSDAEATQSGLGWDFLSNGFKIRNSYNDSNASSATYVGFAWAESPFAYSRAR